MAKRKSKFDNKFKSESSHDKRKENIKTERKVRRCLKRQPSFFVMQPVYYPFLYLKYLWSSQLLLFEKSSYRNK